MRAPTPTEVCAEIAAEHAANTLAAIGDERGARLAAEVESYSKALSELADELGRAFSSEEEASGRKLTAAQYRRAERLFELAATRVDQCLGKRVKDASTVRAMHAEQGAWFAQSFNDGDCEYTLELTAVRSC